MSYDKSWIAVPLCGIVGGFCGGVFSKIIIRGGRYLNKTRFSIVTIAFACGIVISILGYISNGDTFGTGYSQAKAILTNSAPMDPFFPLFKMLASCATFFSGIPSGIFVPSIATGAGVGVNLAHWFPVAPASAMILLTMTAYFSGMLQSPLTSFVIVMEMTGSHEILIPLMATSFFATGTSKLINPLPLYRALCNSYVQPKKTDET